MRITEVDETNLRQRNVPGYYEEEEDEYITDDEEFFDGEDEDPKEDGVCARIARVAASLAPNQICKTISISSGNLLEKSKSVAKTAGNFAWILTTSMILIGIPVLLAYDREKNDAMQAGQMMPLDGKKN